MFERGATDLVTLQWHGDTFDLPDGAVRLAGSPAYANQAFRFERAYGVQFHLEVSAEMAREWAEVPEYVASLERTLGRRRGASLPRRDRGTTRMGCARTGARSSSAGSTASSLTERQTHDARAGEPLVTLDTSVRSPARPRASGGVDRRSAMSHGPDQSRRDSRMALPVDAPMPTTIDRLVALAETRSVIRPTFRPSRPSSVSASIAPNSAARSSHATDIGSRIRRSAGPET